ncbi:MAG: helix-turn-helix domain-containing protein [Betaproteobacteria bacterium]|nr:helix-turn-helix domain-containing protein [Betaproteobacteria bacterium]
MDGTASAQVIFSYMPIEVFLDKRITLEQLRVLGALFSFRGKDSNTVFPSRKAIAKRCGMHQSNISTATTALERLGWLTKIGKGGFSKATRYTITVPETVADSATVG